MAQKLEFHPPIAISRRWFIVGGLAAGGGLALAYGLSPFSRLGEQRALSARPGEAVLHGLVRIANSGQVTVIVPHGDMGVGNGTALAQMLAEELDADWSQVGYERAPADIAYANGWLARAFLRGDSQIPGALAGISDFGARKVAEQMRLQLTGGSTAVRFTGVDGMRRAGAAARFMLVQAAAKKWGVPATEISVANGRIKHPSGKDVGFGAFAEDAALLDPPADVPLKDRKTYRIVGQPLPRFDIPGKVDGSAIYAQDIRREGMVYAAIRNCPVPGGTLASVDEAPLSGRRGIVKAVKLPDAVAVLADNFWRAKEAVYALEPKWTPGVNGQMSSAATLAAMQTAVKTAKDLSADYSRGDVVAAKAKASKAVNASYAIPYLCHAQMEPMSCGAQFAGGTLEIWGGFQDALQARYTAAEVAGIAYDKVKVTHTALGGSFGRRIYFDALTQCVRIAMQADGKPVSLMYTREEDMTQGKYRNISAAHFEAALDKDGMLTAIDYRFAEKKDPPEASQIFYDVPNVTAAYADGLNKAPWGAWRSVDHTVHGFFVESFIDEAAHAAGQDPVAFRRAHLKNKPRHLAVLNAAADMARWSEKRPERTGLGVALVESFGTVVAEVAEVSVDASGAIKVNAIWVAADPGEVINPDGFAAQMQSAAIYGLSAALHGEITYEAGEVAQRNFPDYPVVQMADAPKIYVRTIETGAPTGGGGEPATPGVPPAVCNAIFAAIGVRVRDLPLSKAKLA
jgi:isoquinoline 1-oxidoreductase beta subunit